MSDEAINQIINKYIGEHLSPKQEQRDYISEKYEEIREFLKDSCFQSGSYARYTANDPVHDLDVIHPVLDTTIQNNPSIVIDSLYATLEEGYASSKTQVKKIYRQSHSVTIEFADAPEDFSIDVVPAIEQPNELNEYEQPLYLVPEILSLNKHNRQERYTKLVEEPINWIKSDPRGYIKATSDLNENNSDFRHTAKLLKAWRHACKIEYGNDFCLKSFHLEQIIFEHFINHEGISTLDAGVDCLGLVSDCLTEPKFPDRADSGRFIDEYVIDLSSEQRQLILRLQTTAFEIIRKLPGCQNEREIIDCLEKLLVIHKQTSTTFISVAQSVTPHQPWSY
ncbi:nucleotidyltransferase [Candidatus Microgenomates bacterium]|nr:MAG: nucleotidyltransferase [Candidatus Microgenomates bacterium]